MRQLAEQGLHPLWATVCFYTLSWLVILVLRRRAWRELLATPSLWVIMAAAGTTNTFFNWGVATGDVVAAGTTALSTLLRGAPDAASVATAAPSMSAAARNARMRSYSENSFASSTHSPCGASRS